MKDTIMISDKVEKVNLPMTQAMDSSMMFQGKELHKVT